ncbi:MAG: hypothetical protein EBT22_06770 [Chloroflexi bacterium]|nr:hypothetical protein [Chloroflexota bacterium]
MACLKIAVWRGVACERPCNLDSREPSCQTGRSLFRDARRAAKQEDAPFSLRSEGCKPVRKVGTPNLRPERHARQTGGDSQADAIRD